MALDWAEYLRLRDTPGVRYCVRCGAPIKRALKSRPDVCWGCRGSSERRLHSHDLPLHDGPIVPADLDEDPEMENDWSD